MTHLVGVRVEDIIECKRLIRAEDDLRFTRSHKCANSTHVDDFTRDLGPYSVDRGEGKKLCSGNYLNANFAGERQQPAK